MKKLVILACTLMILTTFVSCGESSQDDSAILEDNVSDVITETNAEQEASMQNETAEQITENETTQAETEELTTVEAISETESEQESNITIVSHSLSKDYEDKDVLVIEYAYTNVKDDATSFSFACQDSVFQNGIECSSTIFGCDEVDVQQQLNDVQPGVTYNLKVGYLLQDMTNAHVVITDLFGNKTLLDETIDLGGGEGAVVDAENLQETYVKVVGHHMSKDYKDEDVLVVDYEYYNGSDESKSFIWSFSAKAFQNGVECDDTVLGCDDINSENSMNEIQPGVTITVSKGYHVTDMSDVTIQVEGLLNDKEYTSEVISLS
ncbi:MAG: DUF5067 domain-containing protein [Oscillospiraceae bacterium]|nr:DUF5067 domain-containing protein [Ruminococcus sp.]MDE6708110.1 DUF5067 domain-containing protein [Oscillospiraceae bacterium]